MVLHNILIFCVLNMNIKAAVSMDVIGNTHSKVFFRLKNIIPRKKKMLLLHIRSQIDNKNTGKSFDFLLIWKFANFIMKFTLFSKSTKFKLGQYFNIQAPWSWRAWTCSWYSCHTILSKVQCDTATKYILSIYASKTDKLFLVFVVALEFCIDCICPDTFLPLIKPPSKRWWSLKFLVLLKKITKNAIWP